MFTVQANDMGGLANGGDHLWEAVGEVLGAGLVGVTLIYLAFQLRENTSALSSSTFQAVSSAMASNMEFFSGDATISALLNKAQDGLGKLTAEERAQGSVS